VFADLEIPHVFVRVTKRISNQQTPIADLEYPYTFSAIDTLV